ncbi:MAG: hypothetical protein NE334_10575 [Lentisphaeraceae bacterium]|nr:hypothetical protein [Lentisphaeraceae bacterium]
MIVSFVSLENFGEFLEKFFIKGLSLVIVFLLLYLCKNRRRLNFSFKNKEFILILLIVFFDLTVRIIYTFMNRENSTRYFLIQITFWIVPAAVGLGLLCTEIGNRRRYLKVLIICLLICWGAIRSSKPDRHRNELHEIARIVREDNNSNKYIYGDEDYYLEAARANYYSGIFRDPYIEAQKSTSIKGSSRYLMAGQKRVIFMDQKLRLLKKILTSKNKVLYFYEIVGK